MLNKKEMVEVRDHILNAIEDLMKAIRLTDPEPRDFLVAELRKAIAIIIGDLDVEVLCKLYKVHPEIDDLASYCAAFHLLFKFTPGLSEKEAISEQDIVSVAEYLSVTLPSVQVDKKIRLLQDELLNQNKFLTHHLFDEGMEAAEIYARSQFVREIVARNRSKPNL